MIEIDSNNVQVARMQYLIPDVPIKIVVGDILPLLERSRIVANICIKRELWQRGCIWNNYIFEI